ncbi:hypothetical protein CRE_01953 [Caenorhabditis remanei]|uniref:Domain of unknown function WSN domain-containing protein n=1 Tax=Caenorhabditis remanei TaxID=31234 RepID=E3LGH0_CAERE|nr:hypothetical protein CRE_01953 [Caenorhabditis remanei]
MKVWKLLFIGILAVPCYLNALSTTDNPPVSIIGKEGSFSRISEMIGAYARVSIGLYILGELIESSSPNLAIAGYMNINETIVDAWLRVDGKEAVAVVNGITRAAGNGTKGIQVDDYLDRIVAFEKVFTEIVNGPPIPSNSELKRMSQIIDEFKQASDVPIARLTSLENEIKAAIKHSNVNFSDSTEIDEFRRVNKIAIYAMEQYPGEVKSVTEKLKKFDGILNFTDIYGPIQKRITKYDEYLTQSNTNLNISNLATVQKIFSKSSDYQVASKIAESLKTLTLLDETSSLGRIWAEVFKNDFTELEVLKQDLDSPLLKNTLNGGEDLEVLKKVMNPIFDIGKIVSGFWTDSDAIFRDIDFKEQANIIQQLLTSMAEVSNLEKSVAAVSSMLKLKNISKELDDFKTNYDKINLDGFLKQSQIVDKLNETHKYAYEVNIHIPHWISVVEEAERTKSLNNYKEASNSDKYEKFKNDHPLSTILADYREAVKDIRKTLSSNINFPNSQVNAMVAIATSLNKTMEENEKSLTEVKAALNFIKISQKGENCAHFVSKIGTLEKIMDEKRKQLDTEREKLKDSPDAEFYKEVVKLNKGFNVKAKLVAGSNLFKIFDRIVKDNKFDGFFEAGDVLYKKIQELPFSNQNRFEWILKMKKLHTIKSRYEELKKEILVRKQRYNNVPMENLIQLRWLIENLYELPNPELKVEEWKQFAGLESLKNNTSGGNELANFEKAIERISDLDFAEYQKNVPNTYANLRALIRFHNAILATEKVSSKTFWDWNHQWIEIVGFVAITLILNALAYGGAALYIRKKNMTPEELAKRKERKKLEEKEESEEKAKNKTDPNSKAKEKKGTTTNVKARR